MQCGIDLRLVAGVALIGIVGVVDDLAFQREVEDMTRQRRPQLDARRRLEANIGDFVDVRAIDVIVEHDERAERGKHGVVADAQPVRADILPVDLGDALATILLHEVILLEAIAACDRLCDQSVHAVQVERQGTCRDEAAQSRNRHDAKHRAVRAARLG